MTDYSKLVNELRITERICRPRMDGQVMLDAADAIEALQAEQKKTVTHIFGEEQQKWMEYCTALGNRIKELEQQMPKRGEWELIDGAEPMRWGCSRCKYLSWETSNYCPRCGAKMDGDVEHG
jgi:rubrerythrin